MHLCRQFYTIRIPHLTHSSPFIPVPCRVFSVDAVCQSPPDHRASSKLFADAAHEEAEEKPPPKLPIKTDEYENWTGEESMHDAVLRMLVDKHKPLRMGTIRTAEEKLRQAPPQISSALSAPLSDDNVGPSAILSDSKVHDAGQVGGASEPLLPSIEGHRPWHTTFKAPSHATSSVRYGRIASSKPSLQISHLTDEKARKKEKEFKKRSLNAQRLGGARDSTLDYQLGIKGSQGTARPNPASVKGWASLVEERIERARLQGAFKAIKGRGQPIQRKPDEWNPFVGREEYLLNRIVQRQGAAPPWVEIQGELERAVTSFRGVLRDSWTRRAIRTLTMSQPAGLIPPLTLSYVRALRDAEWEERERAYHDTAVEELNSLVRNYNALAPYAVRRPYHVRQVELEKAYQECGEEILQGIAQRLQDQARTSGSGTWAEDEQEGQSRGGASVIGQDAKAVLRIRDVIGGWFRWRR